MGFRTERTFWEQQSEKVIRLVMDWGWLLKTILWVNRTVSLVIIWYAVSQFSLPIIFCVDSLYEVKPSIGREHLISSTWSLDMSLLLLPISIGAAYLITLTIIELVSMSLVLILEYLKISFRTVKQKFTIEIIRFTVAILLNPEVMNISRPFAIVQWYIYLLGV